MAVRKRKWKTNKGVDKEAWVVDYSDQTGRHIETFARKKDADARHAEVTVDIGKGVHTSHAQSLTVGEAADRWIEYIRLEGREASTIAQYTQHAEFHIKPRIGDERLSKLTTPRVQAFRDELLRDISRPLAKKVLTSLKSLLTDAQRRGNATQNVARGVSIRADKRQKKRIQSGVDFPTREEVKTIVEHVQGRWRPLIITAIFTGLRASELRGLRWEDVDIENKRLHVRQRADRYNVIGSPKSEAGNRVVPLPPLVVNTLREWKISNGSVGLVFGNTLGKVESLANIINRGLVPPQIAGGVVNSRGIPTFSRRHEKQKAGDLPLILPPAAKYTGMHSLRHFYASWCINPKPAGLGLSAKVVQERLGHSSIVMTMDVYGHLFPSDDEGEEMAAAESALLA
ncbi:integrase [Rhodoligotrophos appendicifer]|uniref:tyrosine-type recombinase/integrase n=1 Tax=Rhodoligotrophos appendicifer TaxID=987056 RepID=UPI001186B0E7|nr:site-specific integrase [Rhodoligotrophos appendicifer]